MKRWSLVLSLVAAVVAPGITLAFCPSGYPDEILCEDFDTYCAPGQFPGGAGSPMGTVCPPGTPAAGNDANLRLVWPQTSCIDESLANLCGTPAILDDSVLALPYYYPASLPFASKYFNRNKDTETPLPIAQHTFRDWFTGELNLSRFIASAAGDSRFKAILGMDDQPLVLTFEFNAEKTGAIFYSDGFMELAFGPPTDPLNRANTDYIIPDHCWITCNKLVNQGPFPIVCAIGNPEVISPGGNLAHPACPSVINNPPPIHRAIAAGALPMLDQAPCHCADGASHGGNIYNPVFFDGQLWWVIMENAPYPTTGSVTPLNGATMPPPIDIHKGGAFLLWGGPVASPHNWMTLTIKEDTVTIELRTIETSRLVGGYEGMQYEVVSVMEGFPLKYKGPFDSLRNGVGPGCRFANNQSWTTCAAGTTRGCLTSIHSRARYVEFDDISLSGGALWRPEGACCLSPSGGCQDELLQDACEALEGGTFAGSNTTCADVVCCPTPYADADTDGDVDADDFGALQLCYTGNMIVSGKCSCFDRNGDERVNQQDVEAFIICATGPAIVPGVVPPQCMP